ncbi:MAG: ABC transporter permease [Deltaproteobacteria bacterium]|nr:ABC transporter permease [Deltaproteobacteria bacterium]MBW2129385.1 ABC transporter permease [Deltaproteobacteria bacterium]MBW2303727.1 ABC transporter permease [Deltaproteobacteria bacterium]
MKPSEESPIDTNSLRYKFRLFMKNKPAIAGLAILAVVFVLVLFGEALAPHDPLGTCFKEKLMGPTLSHPFGTDNYGRDIMSRIFAGARYTLLSALVAVMVGILAGTPLGLVSGYFGRGIDMVFMRVADVLLAFPPLILAMAIVSGLGPSLLNAALAIGISYIPIFARMARSRAIQVKRMDYIQAAYALGSGHLRIILTDVLPNCMTPLIVQGTIYTGYGVLWVASLSFIGLGAKLPTPEWGLMIAEGRQYIINGQWWTTVFPGLFIMLGVAGCTLIGDGLREVFNPKLRLK